MKNAPDFTVWIIMVRHPANNHFVPWEGERAFTSKESAEAAWRGVAEQCGFDAYIQMYGPIS